MNEWGVRKARALLPMNLANTDCIRNSARRCQLLSAVVPIFVE